MTEAARAQSPTSSFSVARAATRHDPIRALRTRDVPALSRFLRACFPQSRRSVADEAMLLWKYFAGRAPIPDELSIGIEQDGVLLAHAGLCPVTFIGPRGDAVPSGTIIDWAADARSPGAGLVAYRHLMKRTDTMFLIGGTAETKAATDALGFRVRAEARVYDRWLHPLREFLARPKTWRSPLRLMHGAVHKLMDELAPLNGWSARRTSHFDDEMVAGLRLPPSYGYAIRSAAALNHRLRCPSRSTWGFTLLEHDTPRGYALVSMGRWEAKIIDLRVESTNNADWAAAYATVTERLGQAGISRASALASVPHVELALEANAYWVSGRAPVSFFDPNGVVERLLPLDIQFFESDLAHSES